MDQGREQLLSEHGTSLDLSALSLDDAGLQSLLEEAMGKKGWESVLNVYLNSNEVTCLPVRVDLGEEEVTEEGRYKGLLPEGLKVLDLSDNRLLALSAASLPHKLEELYAENNDGDGNEVLRGLTSMSLPQLRKLDLSGTGIDSLPGEVADAFPNLQSISLNRNCLKDLPDRLAELPLCELYLSGNCLGTLPMVVTKLVHLESLGVGSNNIDTLPDELAKLTDLRSLSLMWNNLHEVPAVIFSLSNLRRLDLGSNKIRSLSDDVKALDKLEELYLAGNHFKLLPNCFNHLVALRRLDISHNPHLTRLPSTLAYLHLDTLNYDDQLEDYHIDPEEPTPADGGMGGKDEGDSDHNRMISMTTFKRGRRTREWDYKCWPLS